MNPKRKDYTMDQQAIGDIKIAIVVGVGTVIIMEALNQTAKRQWKRHLQRKALKNA